MQLLQAVYAVENSPEYHSWLDEIRSGLPPLKPALPQEGSNTLVMNKVAPGTRVEISRVALFASQHGNVTRVGVELASGDCFYQERSLNDINFRAEVEKLAAEGKVYKAHQWQTPDLMEFEKNNGKVCKLEVCPSNVASVIFGVTENGARLLLDEI